MPNWVGGRPEIEEQMEVGDKIHTVPLKHVPYLQCRHTADTPP